MDHRVRLLSGLVRLEPGHDLGEVPHVLGTGPAIPLDPTADLTLDVTRTPVKLGQT